MREEMGTSSSREATLAARPGARLTIREGGDGPVTGGQGQQLAQAPVSAPGTDGLLGAETLSSVGNPQPRAGQQPARPTS